MPEKSSLRILFLGAGKRLSLLEAFLRAGRTEGVSLSLTCAELEGQAPVGEVANVVQAPMFRSDKFSEWLESFVESERFDLVVPNMDSATVVLSAMRTRLEHLGAWPVVSSATLCSAMEDKVLAEHWFASNDIATPGHTAWPRIFKRRFGFGSRGQIVVTNEQERSAFLNSVRAPEDYFEQSWIEGIEYSVDVYVGRTGRFVAAMPRVRLEVVDGEVNTSRSEKHHHIEDISRTLFSKPGWQGPLTAQFIDGKEGVVLLEVNPRFGGGVTHAIHCGLDMPRWLLREALGKPLPNDVAWRAGSLMMRCRRDIFFDEAT